MEHKLRGAAWKALVVTLAAGALMASPVAATAAPSKPQPPGPNLSHDCNGQAGLLAKVRFGDGPWDTC